METIAAFYDIFVDTNFNSEESAFIKKSSKELNKLSEILTKELSTRVNVINFINNINNLDFNIYFDKLNFSIIKLSLNLQELLDKLNININILKTIFKKCSAIHEKISYTFDKIKNPNTDFISEVLEIKNLINPFITETKKKIGEILKNDKVIDKVYNYTIIENYIESLNNIKENENSIDIDTEMTSENTVDLKINIIKNNNILFISEKFKQVFLPYKQSELDMYLEQYPDEYKSYSDVINKEFILSLDYYMKSPAIVRFRELYSLIRDRESKPIIDSLKYALSMMFRADITPVVIAACKTQEQFEKYLECLNKNNLDDFNDFKIKFEIPPLKNYHFKNKNT